MTEAVFGIIGVGGIAQSRHLSNLARAPHARLRTVCDLRTYGYRDVEPVTHFAACVLTGDRRQLADAHDGLWTARMTAAAMASRASGEVVRL